MVTAGVGGVTGSAISSPRSPPPPRSSPSSVQLPLTPSAQKQNIDSSSKVSLVKMVVIESPSLATDQSVPSVEDFQPLSAAQSSPIKVSYSAIIRKARASIKTLEKIPIIVLKSMEHKWLQYLAR